MKKNVPVPQQPFTRFMPYIPALLALALYLNTLHHGFVLDDVAVIEQNRFVQQGPEAIPALLKTFYWQGYWNSNTGLYRPLSLVMFSLEKALSGGSPFVHHLVNVLLYAFSVLLLYRVLQKLPGALPAWAILFITLLFAAFPLHTEVVANIKSRDELLAFLFPLLTLYILVRREHLSALQQAAAAFTFLLALLSKEAAILFPLILLLVFILLRGETPVSSLRKLLPLAGVALLWAGWRYYVIHQLSPPLLDYTYQDNSLLSCGGAAERFSTGVTLFGRYLLHCSWPFRFSYDYSFRQIPCESLTSPGFLLSLAGVAGLLYAAFFFIRKGSRWTGFGILFFLITASFTSNIFFLTGTTYAERLLFTPSLGFIIIPVALLVEQGKSTRLHPALRIALIAVTAVYTAATLNRNGDWKSNEKLFKADVHSAPGSARVHYNYGTALLRTAPERNIRETLAELKTATGIDPQYYDAWFNLGRVHYLAKDYGASVAAFKKARALKGTDPALLHNLADACMMNKEYTEAVNLYRDCIRQNHTRQNTYNFLGSALFSLQRLSEAREAFETGLRTDSSQAELWLNYGNALAAGGAVALAIPAFEKVRQLDPFNKQALYFLSMAYGQTGEPEKSRYYFQWFNEGKQPDIK